MQEEKFFYETFMDDDFHIKTVIRSKKLNHRCFDNKNDSVADFVKNLEIAEKIFLRIKEEIVKLQESMDFEIGLYIDDDDAYGVTAHQRIEITVGGYCFYCGI